MMFNKKPEPTADPPTTPTSDAPDPPPTDAPVVSDVPVTADADLDYAGVTAAISETQTRLRALTTRKAALEEAYARGTHYAEAMQDTFKSDEGIDVARLSGHRVMNVIDPALDIQRAHVLTVHVDGVVYQHVEETPGGHWVYRSDK
jgi:hypothetical protein